MNTATLPETPARRPWWQPFPVAYAWWEILLMRLGLAALLWYRMPPLVPYTSQPSPNGLACWMDLTFLANPGLYGTLHWIFLAMLFLYVSGSAMILALPYLLFIYGAYMSLGNSQGWIGHTDQIVGLVLLVQTVYYFIVAGRKVARKPWVPAAGRTLADLEIYFTLQTIAATYVVAALTKLIKTNGAWVAQLPNITVQIAKTNDQFYYDKLVHENAGFTDWLNQMLVLHPAIAYLIFTPGLVVEAAAFLLLAGRRQAVIIGAVLLGMHGLIHLVMQITFTTNIWLIVVYLLNIPFWLVVLFRWVRGLRRS